MTTGSSAPKRPDISMSNEEIAAFLATQTRAIVVALDDGAPVGTVADLEFDGHRLTLTMPPGDAVGALITTDDRVCVIAEQFPAYYEIKGVSAHGRAEPIDFTDDHIRFTLGLDDTTSFDFGKVPRDGQGSGPAPG